MANSKKFESEYFESHIYIIKGVSQNDEFLCYLKSMRLGTYVSTSQTALISKPSTSFIPKHPGSELWGSLFETAPFMFSKA